MRRRKGFTLATIASAAGLTVTATWRVVHGKCPDVRKIVAVCKALGVSPKRLDWNFFAQRPSAGGHPEGNGEQDPNLPVEPSMSSPGGRGRRDEEKQA
jgi:transcriptional regulator with XRE-family HTH domain